MLDIKFENRDINVVEQANIPKFGKLDDIRTPFLTFELKSSRGLFNYALIVHQLI